MNMSGGPRTAAPLLISAVVDVEKHFPVAKCREVEHLLGPINRAAGSGVTVHATDDRL